MKVRELMKILKLDDLDKDIIVTENEVIFIDAQSVGCKECEIDYGNQL